MVDVISTVSGGMAIGQNVLRFLNIVRGIKDANVIAALFDADGKKTEGDDRIKVIVHTENQPDETWWWYEVEALGDYSFVRFPVIESGIAEVLGTEEGRANPDARYWRWVSRGLPGRIYGSAAPNARVDFVVVGYRPAALVKHFTE